MRYTSPPLNQLTRNPLPTSGFTLIELSIVLVIIGLIVGGVFVGQNLIKAAEIRGTISQYEKFNAAVNTFKGKYGYLPGDIPPSVAAAFGFFQLDACTNPCLLGNGIIDFGDGILPYEGFAFWRHLDDAKLVQGGIFGRDPNYPIGSNGSPPNGSSTNDSIIMPLNNENSFYLIESNLKGAYWSAGQAARASTTDGTVNLPSFTDFLLDNSNSNAITPLEAYAIDQKLDDGIPNQGTVVEGSTSNGAWQATAADGYCTYGGAAIYSANTTYNNNPSTGGNTKSCSLRLKAKF